VCADGRAFHKGQFVISLTPLNLITFPCQSRYSVFQLLLAQQKERKEIVLECSEMVYLDLERLAIHGVTMGSTHIDIEIFFVPGSNKLIKFNKID